MLWLIWACAMEPGLELPGPSERPQLVGELELSLPESPDVHLARVVVLTADRPVRVSWTHVDGDRRHVRPPGELAIHHEVPWIGLAAGRAHVLEVTLTDEAGHVLHLPPVSTTTEELPTWFPRVEVLAHEPALVEPGWLLFHVDAFGGEGPDPVVLLDEQLEVVWWFDPTPSFGAMRWSDRGTMVGLAGGYVMEVDLLGRVVQGWSPFPGLHHELIEQPDGSFWSLEEYSLQVDRYPVAYDQLDVLEPARIRDSRVVRFDPQGTRYSVALADRLDTERISWEGLKSSTEGLEWSHANGMAVDPEDGSVVVSARHQDALVKLSAEGELVWILGDPAGWRSPWSELLLKPVGDLRWAYHHHAPSVQEGLLIVFDNHNHGRTPYDGPPSDETTSRAVAFEIDEERGTVRQAWSVEQTATGPLFSGVVGSALLLPSTGNVLMDYGLVHSEEGVLNAERGWAATHVRFVEIHPDRPDRPVMDLRLFSYLEDQPQGWISYRVAKIPSPNR